MGVEKQRNAVDDDDVNAKDLPPDEEEEEDEERVIPPDGGWGWMVVLSSFIIHIIADGIVYSFGIFFIEFIDYFNSSKLLYFL